MNDPHASTLPAHDGARTTRFPQRKRPSEMDTVLESWQQAATQVQQQHAWLASEVDRLQLALDAKNRELARCRRLAQLGSGCLHSAREIREQLAPVVTHLSLLEQWFADDARCRGVLDQCAEGLAAVVGTVHEMLEFAGDCRLNRQLVGLHALVQEVYDDLLPLARERQIEIVLDMPAELAVEADRDLLRRAVGNLVANALDAMPEGGCLSITAVDCDEVVELEVADSGAGLSDEVLHRAFEPYFSTKGEGGLGLAIVDRIAQLHGGEVLMMNCPDNGAAFTLRIPRHAAPAAEAELVAAG